MVISGSKASVISVSRWIRSIGLTDTSSKNQLGKTSLKGATLTKGGGTVDCAKVGMSFATIVFTRKSW